MNLAYQHILEGNRNNIFLWVLKLQHITDEEEKIMLLDTQISNNEYFPLKMISNTSQNPDMHGEVVVPRNTLMPLN